MNGFKDKSDANFFFFRTGERWGVGGGGGQHSLAGEEAGGPNSDEWRESLALCIICEQG
jgi:hypothetical protein